jgi:hypothetical protein
MVPSLPLGHKSIEDEAHFLCECPLFSNLHGIYLNKDKLGLKNDISGNSLFMFLINSEQHIAGLTAKFIYIYLLALVLCIVHGIEFIVISSDIDCKIHMEPINICNL